MASMETWWWGQFEAFGGLQRKMTQEGTEEGIQISWEFEGPME